jgi:adenylyltransferase/sulfurtransferase
VPGVLGTLQALEALKLILGLPGQLTNAMLLFDLLTLEQRKLNTSRRAECRHDSSLQIAIPAPDLEVALHDLDPAIVNGYSLIDVREPREVSECPVAASTILSIPLATLLSDPTALDHERKYLLVCARGSRSLLAAERLRSLGFRHAYSLRGGLASLR